MGRRDPTRPGTRSPRQIKSNSGHSLLIFAISHRTGAIPEAYPGWKTTCWSIPLVVMSRLRKLPYYPRQQPSNWQPCPHTGRGDTPRRWRGRSFALSAWPLGAWMAPSRGARVAPVARRSHERFFLVSPVRVWSCRFSARST